MIRFSIICVVFIISCQNLPDKEQQKEITSKEDNTLKVQDSLLNTFIGLKRLTLETKDTLITLRRSNGTGNDALLVQVEKKADSIILTKVIWSTIQNLENQDSFIRINPLTGNEDILYKTLSKKEHIPNEKWKKILLFLDQNKFYEIPQRSNKMYIGGSPVMIKVESNNQEHYIFRWATIDSLKPFIDYFQKL